MNYQQHLANSAAIRSEIQRFESVHPNIYSIYELLERVEEPLLQNQIREHVIAIEGRTEGGCCRLGGWVGVKVTALSNPAVQAECHFTSENSANPDKSKALDGLLHVAVSL